MRDRCYLAVPALPAISANGPDGMILVAEEGHSLTAKDVTTATDLSVVATVHASARVARTLDADSSHAAFPLARAQRSPARRCTPPAVRAFLLHR
jgi:hypothetical protein